MEQQLSLDDYFESTEKKEKVNDIDNMANIERISGSKAMQITELSRHSFEKVVKEGLLIPHIDGKKKYYLMEEIQNFMSTDRCKEISESKDLADRTLRKRFMKLLECAHGNVEHLKNPQGNIIFEGEQIKFMTALLEGLATNNFLTLQFIDAPGRKTFRDYHSFL